MVGVTRFELVTSSVSGKRSPPELNAQSSNHILGGTKTQEDIIPESRIFARPYFENLFDPKRYITARLIHEAARTSLRTEKIKSGRFLDRRKFMERTTGFEPATLTLAR